MAVMDSLTHRFSSSKWPMTKQRQSMAMNTEIGITWGCSAARWIVKNSVIPTPILHEDLDNVFCFRRFWNTQHTNRQPKQRHQRETESERVRDLNCAKEGGGYRWREDEGHVDCINVTRLSKREAFFEVILYCGLLSPNLYWIIKNCNLYN